MIKIRKDLHNQFINYHSNITFKELEDNYNSMAEGKAEFAEAAVKLLGGYMALRARSEKPRDIIIPNTVADRNLIVKVAVLLTSMFADCRVAAKYTDTGCEICFLMSDAEWEDWVSVHDVENEDYTVYVSDNVKIEEEK